MAFNIPQIGDELGEHVAAFTVGLSSDTSVDVNFSTSTGVNAIVNDVNVLVKDISAQIITAFDGATSLAFEIGDGDDSDGYWTDTLLVFSSSGAVFSNPASTLAYSAGKLYTSTDTIDVTITGGVLTAGKAKFLITYELGADTNLAPGT
jgi:hypothetical protein